MDELTENPWRTVGRRTVYRNPWLSVREDRVIRPDGTEGIYGVVEIPLSCGIAVRAVMTGQITESVSVAGILKAEFLDREHSPGPS
jgi:hypothetical protein